MDEVRLINATPLEKEMQEYALYIGRKEVFTTFDRHTDHVYCCRCGCKMEAAVGSEVREK